MPTAAPTWCGSPPGAAPTSRDVWALAGALLESRKDAMETVGTDEETGEELHCKVVEVVPRVQRPAGVKAPKSVS